MVVPGSHLTNLSGQCVRGSHQGCRGRSCAGDGVCLEGWPMRTVSRGRQYLVTKDNALTLQGFKWSLGMVSKQLARPQEALPTC